MKNIYSFTIKSEGYLDKLKSSAIVHDIFGDKSKEYMALWDTGATDTSISSLIVSELGLVSTGEIYINTAAGYIKTPIYIIDLELPNGILINGLKVSEVRCGEETDIIIGMDIIRRGDFSITNVDGHTTFSFRIPSVEEIDYTK